MVNQYQYKFYLNANHAIFINNVLGQVHPHTWEITIDLLNVNDKFIQFNKIETVINEYLEQYQDKLLNSVEPFNKINPTLENVVLYFKDKFSEILNEYNLLLLSIEISETPSRSYIINLYDEVDIRLLNMNKIQNDEDSFINQIILDNKKEERIVKSKEDIIAELKENIKEEPAPKIVKTEEFIIKNKVPNQVNKNKTNASIKISTRANNQIKKKRNQKKNTIIIPIAIKNIQNDIFNYIFKNIKHQKRKSH